jgi:hypothetical protein
MHRYLKSTELGAALLACALSASATAILYPGEQKTVCVFRGSNGPVAVVTSRAAFDNAPATALEILMPEADGTWVAEQPVIRISSSARLDATAARLREAVGASNWWAAGDLCISGCQVLVWETEESPEDAATAAKVWSVSERSFASLRLLSTESEEKLVSGLANHLPDARGVEWKGKRYLVGYVAYSDGDESRGRIWVAPLPPASANAHGREVLEGGRFVLEANSPAVACYGDKLLLSARPGFNTMEELQFFLTTDIGDWNKAPAFTGPQVLDEYDILAVGKDVWVAGRDATGVLKAWLRPDGGDWKPVTITGDYPATQVWRVWLVASDPDPEVVYQTDGGEFVRVPLR